MRIDLAKALLLRECVERQAPELHPLLQKVGSVRLSVAEREKLREVISLELSATGLDSLGGHNQRGVALDDLIDLLGHL